MRRWLILFLVAITVSAAARVPSSEMVARLPHELGGFIRGQTTDYESRTPGLGLGVTYRASALRAVADVYIFDLRRDDLPDEGLDDPAPAALAALVADVEQLRIRRQGMRVTDTGRFTLPLDGVAQLTCVTFLIVLPDESERTSLGCIGFASGWLVKLRATAAERASEPLLHDFARAALRTLRTPRP